MEFDLDARKPVLCGFRTTKAQTSLRIRTQSDHGHIIRTLESIISKLATSDFFFIFLLVSEAKETGLSLAVSETTNTGFATSRLHWFEGRRYLYTQRKTVMSPCGYIFLRSYFL